MANQHPALTSQIKILQDYAASLKHDLMVFEANNAHYFRQQKANDEFAALSIAEYTRKKIMAEQIYQQLQAMIKEEKIQTEKIEYLAEIQKQQVAQQIIENEQKEFEQYMQLMLENSKSELQHILAELTTLTTQFTEMLSDLETQIHIANVDYQNAHQELDSAVTAAFDFTLNPGLTTLKELFPDDKVRQEFLNHVGTDIRNLILTEAANETSNQRQFAEQCAKQIKPLIETEIKSNPAYIDINANAEKISHILVKAILSNEQVHQQVQRLHETGKSRKSLDLAKATTLASQDNIITQTDKMGASFAAMHATPNPETAKNWQNDLADCAILLKHIKQVAHTMKEGIKKCEQQGEQLYKHSPFK